MSFVGHPIKTRKIQTHIEVCVLTLTKSKFGIYKSLSEITSLFITNALFHYLLMVWKEHYLLEEILKKMKTLEKK